MEHCKTSGCLRGRASARLFVTVCQKSSHKHRHTHRHTLTHTHTAPLDTRITNSLHIMARQGTAERNTHIACPVVHEFDGMDVANTENRKHHER